MAAPRRSFLSNPWTLMITGIFAAVIALGGWRYYTSPTDVAPPADEIEQTQ
ncbi:hypothetical protein [Pararhizobium haloflavum]|uniref:hypothetical protein n=1 Tax=Pararhizobium haloflavum TaxID=2037914 RepID=UPI0013000E67|nr:hypothetical protein [Pararhizobium haloflavum]